MKRNEYLETRQGQVYEWRKRSLDILYLKVAQEPKGKGSHHPNDKIDFRKQIKSQLKEQNRRAFRGDIILQIDFYTTEDNPPALHTLSKNYLDLLHKPIDKLDKLNGILFKDDNQVKILIANRHLKNGEEGEAAIIIKAYRFSHFIEDISLANRIINNDFAPNEDCFSFLNSDFEFQEECFDSECYGGLEQLKDYDSNEEDYKKVLGERGFLAMRTMCLRQAQEDFLRLNNISIQELISLFQSLFSSNRRYSSEAAFQMLWEMASKMISLSINQIELGDAPVKKGDSNKLKKTLEQKLIEFRKKYKILFPLLLPISITVFYTPPIFNILDLDNLARRVIPLVIKEFSPPEDSLLAYYDYVGEQCEHGEKECQKYEKSGVSSYQIINLQRKTETSDGGSIDFCIANGMFRDNNIWQTVESCISKFEKEAS